MGGWPPGISDRDYCPGPVPITNTNYLYQLPIAVPVPTYTSVTRFDCGLYLIFWEICYMLWFFVCLVLFLLQYKHQRYTTSASLCLRFCLCLSKCKLHLRGVVDLFTHRYLKKWHTSNNVLPFPLPLPTGTGRIFCGTRHAWSAPLNIFPLRYFFSKPFLVKPSKLPLLSIARRRVWHVSQYEMALHSIKKISCDGNDQRWAHTCTTDNRDSRCFQLCTVRYGYYFF